MKLPITTSPYSPTANGLCERLNATLVDTIATLFEDVIDSDDYVNQAIHSMTSETNFYSINFILYSLAIVLKQIQAFHVL